MTSLRNPSTASWKRFRLSTAAIVMIAIICSLSTAGWSQERDNDGKRDGDVSARDDRDRGRGPDRDDGRRDIDVATFNLYVGADFSPILTAPSLDAFLNGVVTVYSRIVQSNFPKRADALAREIVARGPDVVALQEVSLIRRQSPGDSLFGGTPATVVDLDYLEILLDALHRHGGHYATVSQVEDTDVEVPLMTSPSTFDDIRLTDRDVILVRTDVPREHLRTFNPQGANYVARLPLPIGAGVYALRGWCSIDIQALGRSFRVINTHLEDKLPTGAPNFQLAQASELLAGPANTALPVILAGDFNSDAWGHYSSDTYALLTHQGHFNDAWNEAGGRSLGLTWGHDEFLSDLSVPFIYRLDLILLRGGDLEATEARTIDPVIGRSAPLWFSDHAGVFATLKSR
jgi:endonuclease/exonuclease/phosphatase family metal-dependent hydrolase